jgi:hypothetical protein
MFQISGLVLAQCSGSPSKAYPAYAYVNLVTQVFLSALAAVCSQALFKSDGASLHAGNICLSAISVLVNMMAYGVVRMFRAKEPSFWAGYDSLDGIINVASNVFIGLAITAVYKCQSPRVWVCLDLC